MTSRSCVATSTMRPFARSSASRSTERRRRRVVETRERLVEQHEPRVVQQRSLEGQALAHAARKALHGVVAPVGQVGALECRVDSPHHVRNAVQPAVEQEVLRGRQLGIEVEIVTDEADPLPQRRRRVSVVLAVRDATARRRQQRRGHRQQRGLAGAVGPEQRDDLARLAAQRDAVERPAPAVAARDVGKREGGEVHGSRLKAQGSGLRQELSKAWSKVLPEP